MFTRHHSFRCRGSGGNARPRWPSPRDSDRFGDGSQPRAFGSPLETLLIGHSYCRKEGALRVLTHDQARVLAPIDGAGTAWAASLARATTLLCIGPLEPRVRRSTRRPSSRCCLASWPPLRLCRLKTLDFYTCNTPYQR